MEYRNLGSSGLKVSIAGLGCNNFGMRIDEAAAAAVVHKALDLGINFFDTADIYGDMASGRLGLSEEYLGRALGVQRKDVIIVTKFGIRMDGGPRQRDSSYRYVMQAVEASLKRLATDYIDVYMIHWPDADTPLIETMEALDSLVRQGKVRYLAHSNFAPSALVEGHYLAQQKGLARFITAQNSYSLLDRGLEAELIPAALKYGVGLMPYSPLAGGLLTGKYKKDETAPSGTRLAELSQLMAAVATERNFDKIARLEAFASDRGHTMLELAMSWLACQPVVSSVIAGATTPEQVEQNAGAVGWQLSADELAEIDSVTKGK